MVKWANNLPMSLIADMASEACLPPALVAALVQKESGGRQFAVRFEPTWRHFLDPKHFAKQLLITELTERHCQACSVGLMQVMFTVFRELGFQRSFAEAFDPGVNLHYGCKKLSQLMRKYGSVELAVSAYNQGTPRRDADGTLSNQDYVDDVMNYWALLEKDR